SSSSTKISVSFNFSRFGITKGSWLSLWGRLKDAFFFDSKTTGTSWLEANSSVDLVNQNQTNTDMLPDWTKLSTTERVRYLLEAGAASDTKLVNIHNVFKNFNPQSGDLQYGIMVSKPVVVNLGGTNYRIGMQLYVNPRTSDNYYNPVFDIHINNPNRITTGYGECTIYNIGSRTQMYLLIYGDESQSDIFEKWYPIG
ncbi:MAG TPA: hypothetical protein VMW01_08425, partial [Williamwhitmania sp.]|nr:hypothetical protein [Williamwhitmania sp.]